MMVISAIMLLSMIVLEFVYGTNINYRIAVNEKERLQAYYLAQSALNLMKVELKMDKQFKSMLSSSPLGQNIPIDLSQPICQQFPFSTSLIRTFFIGGTLPTAAGEEAPEEEIKTIDEAKKETAQGNAFEAETAQDFLSFDGDFDGTCVNEESKINLNYFSDADPAQQALSGLNAYDAYKLMLTNFLKQDRFKKLFAKPEDIDEAVKNIADWTDKNDTRNDLNNTSSGTEASIYKGDNVMNPKNTKFISMDELHLVEGVDDEWFLPLEDMFTIYGGSKVNVCQASEDIVWSLVLSYLSQNPNMPAINQNDPELKKKIVEAVQFSCTGANPQASKIASDLDAALGITASGSSSFANMISTESRYYSLKLSGQVNDTVVNIRTVLDTKDADPKKWKMLYYKAY